MAGKEVLSKSEIDALKKEWLAEMKANMKVKYLRKRGSICVCLCALKDLANCYGSFLQYCFL